MEGEGDVTMTTEGLDWKFSQVFGERTAGEHLQEGTIQHHYTFFCFKLSYIDFCIEI